MPMNFPYLKSARVKLQERKNTCLRSKYENSPKYISQFLEFLQKDPVIKSIHAELTVISQSKFTDPNILIDREERCLNLPDSEKDSAAFYLRVLEVLIDPNVEFPFMRIFGKGSNRFQDMYDDFFQQVLVPLCSYIDERIDDGDLLLYLLTRYQRECVWFEADAIAKLADSADSRKMEEVLDQHLRAWLFREGIDYPFSTPKSPSGRADIVIWHGEQPLAIEVKVYDGLNRDTGHISQGLWQAQRYAHDYGKPFGYLVVFNKSSDSLAYENNIGKDGPPCVEVGGLNVFAITINLGVGRLSASKEKPTDTRLVKTPTNG